MPDLDKNRLGNDDFVSALFDDPDTAPALVAAAEGAAKRGEPRSNSLHVLLVIATATPRRRKHHSRLAPGQPGARLLRRAGVDLRRLAAALEAGLPPPHDNLVNEAYRERTNAKSAYVSYASERVRAVLDSDEETQVQVIEELAREAAGLLTSGSGWTSELRSALEASIQEARTAGQPAPGTAYLLVGMIREEDCLAGRFLRECGLTAEKLRLLLAQDRLSAERTE